MNMMRDLTSVVLASEQVSLGSVDDARDMVREADNPELAAAYQRIDELSRLLSVARDKLAETEAYSWGDVATWVCVDAIDDALENRALS